MLKLHPFVLYSIQSLGLLALLYKLFRYIRVRRLASTYFHDKTVLITGASQGLGKGWNSHIFSVGLCTYCVLWFFSALSYCARALSARRSSHHLCAQQ